MATTKQTQEDTGTQKKSAGPQEETAEIRPVSGAETGWVMDPQQAADTTRRMVENATPEEAELERLKHLDTEREKELLEQQTQAQRQQVEQQVDFAVEQGVKELKRNEADAQEQFQTQRDQIAADELRALDNQALYAEARGDRGGLGQAQYASIQNTAAANRMRVSQAQTKLSTDTARQIEDLRAQGEFQKADKLLAVTQNYLSQLMQLEQWAKEMNLSVDQFNAQLTQWELQYRLSVKQFLTETELSAARQTGAFSDGTLTFDAQSQLRKELAEAGKAMIELGLDPTPQQLAAMGWTQDQFNAYKSMLEEEHYYAGSGGWGGGKKKTSSTTVKKPGGGTMQGNTMGGGSKVNTSLAATR